MRRKERSGPGTETFSAAGAESSAEEEAARAAAHASEVKCDEKHKSNAATAGRQRRKDFMTGALSEPWRHIRQTKVNRGGLKKRNRGGLA
jgi:hypothetical protein